MCANSVHRPVPRYAATGRSDADNFKIRGENGHPPPYLYYGPPCPYCNPYSYYSAYNPSSTYSPSDYNGMHEPKVGSSQSSTHFVNIVLLLILSLSIISFIIYRSSSHETRRRFRALLYRLITFLQNRRRRGNNIQNRLQNLNEQTVVNTQLQKQCCSLCKTDKETTLPMSQETLSALTATVYETNVGGKESVISSVKYNKVNVAAETSEINSSKVNKSTMAILEEYKTDDN